MGTRTKFTEIATKRQPSSSRSTRVGENGEEKEGCENGSLGAWAVGCPVTRLLIYL